MSHSLATTSQRCLLSPGTCGPSDRQFDSRWTPRWAIADLPPDFGATAQNRLFDNIHSGPLAPHLGAERMLAQILRHCYCRGMRRDVMNE